VASCSRTARRAPCSPTSGRSNDLSPDLREASARDAALLSTVLRSYGQKPEDTQQMLRSVGSRLGLDLRVVVHGHDRDEAGFFVEGENQLCTVLFGAPDANKRYLVLDLGRAVLDRRSLPDGHEIRRLYGEGTDQSG